VNKSVVYKIAQCQSEREAAFKLVYDRYVDAGLIEPNQRAIRVTPFQLLNSTDIVIAVLRGKVVSTVSLILDAKFGLQMETIYSPEVASLRKRGLRLAEVSCLASSRDLIPSDMFDIFVNVVAFTIQLARYRRVQQLLIAIHPDHEPFYRRLLGFRKIGSDRCYPAVRGNLAVACAHEFALLDRQPYPLHDVIYEVSYSSKAMQSQPIGPIEREYFLRLIDDDDVALPQAA
jgi:hypothetical protein